MPSGLTIIACLAVLLLNSPAQARGKPDAYTTSSIERIAATSATILQGNVARVDGANRSFTIDVKETLRGNPVSQYTYSFPDDLKMPEFVVPGRRVLLFISQYDRPRDYYYPPFDLESEYDPPFWTTMGVAVSTPDRLLTEIRTAVAETPQGKQKPTSTRPLNPRMAAVLESRGNLFTIPMDARVQPLADRMLTSGDEGFEWQGLYLLAQLPTPQNIERLRHYLADPRLRLDLAEPRLSPWSQRVYYFRKWACDLLALAEAPPAASIRLTEPANIYRPVLPWILVLLAILIGMWIGLGRFRVFHPRSHRLLLFGGGSLLLLAALWVRSYHRIDDFCYANGRQLYALSTQNGRIRFEIVYAFPHSTPLAYSAFKPFTQWQDLCPWHEMAPDPRMGKLLNIRQQRSPFPQESAGYNFWITTQPLWRLLLLLLICTAIPATFVVRGVLRMRRSRKLNLCPICGYDLRATPDQCPECGNIPSQTQVNAASR